ncbi:MAG: thrombospondin type 3 repeat-containing protein [Kofleriaceae bacterium]
MRLWGVLVATGLCAGLGAPRLASAQAMPPADRAIDVQNFDYSIGPKTFFSVDNGAVADKHQLALDALVTFLSNPFTIYNTVANGTQIGTQRDQVVSSLTEMQLTGAYGITDRLQLGANLPFVFSLAGDGLDPTTGMHASQGLQVTGLGDLIVEAKLRLWQDPAMRLAGIAGISIPTSFGSDGSQFIGDDLPTLRGRLAWQWTRDRLSLGANGGFIVRKPRTVYSSTIGQQLVWGVAAAFAVTSRFNLIAESFGRTGVTSFAVDESPIEALGGLRVNVASSVAVVVGGGAGLDRAIGAPNARFFVSVGFAPDVRDSDGDGIENSRDKCPLVPEDKDGFQDEDGCPDDDNDGDRRPDAVDKCPNAAEDIDGFEDDDGCPDLDNDKDGIPDLQDKCPDDAEDGKPPFPHDGCPADKHDSDGDGIPDSRDKCPLEEEDKDGFEDEDGCPDLDNDGDGIPDAQDKCPLCPEDKDGFEDADGCPDLDNDHDGIPDAQDKCPNDPETINGVQDDDGCPDTGGLQVVTLDGDRLDVSKLPTLDHGGLSAAGQIIVHEMALTMRSHPEITRWLIAVALPSKADAQKLGDAIQARLAQRDVTQVDVLAGAGPAKLGAVVQERVDPAAPPACPAGLAKPAHDAPAAIEIQK